MTIMSECQKLAWLISQLIMFYLLFYNKNNNTHNRPTSSALRGGDRGHVQMQHFT